MRNGDGWGFSFQTSRGINTVEEQISIARRKAGIGLNAPVELERFEVTRYE